MPDDKAITEEEEQVLDNVRLDAAVEETQEDPDPDLDEGPAVPKVTDPEWSNYVLNQFKEDEKDGEGHPYVGGLRRVVRLLLGPIIESTSKVVQAPSFMTGLEKLQFMQPAVVEHTIKVHWCKQEDEHAPYDAVFTECADVTHHNCDAQFARFATATASTRAEARALRKALQLQRVIAAEESTNVPLEEPTENGQITATQKSFMNVLCQRNNINLKKFINMGKTKYSKIDDVPYSIAARMVEHLSAMQNGNVKVPPSIIGFEQEKAE